jgi:xanthosine utilization system XapX-like protein
MGLHLKHPDSIVQLLGHVVILVGEQVVDPDSVRVMRTDKSDISITSAA